MYFLPITPDAIPRGFGLGFGKMNGFGLKYLSPSSPGTTGAGPQALINLRHTAWTTGLSLPKAVTIFLQLGMDTIFAHPFRLQLPHVFKQRVL